TELVVVRPPESDIDFRCGGAPLIDVNADQSADQSIAEGHRGGTLLGKRYSDEGSGIEVLCTKPGEGSLSIGDTPLLAKEAKPLPASD
ncbi:MAG TPA: hypothetical protein VG205_01380, partial [Acidimicrobiales bacterium]|nr:hypothetical protein [Acidimicrobiales bacterium]